MWPGRSSAPASLLVHLERQQLAQPCPAPGVERHVAARLQLQALQRGLEFEAPAVHRRGKRQDRRLECLTQPAVPLELGQGIAHVQILVHPRVIANHPGRVREV